MNQYKGRTWWLFKSTGDRMKCSLCLAGWKADGRKGPGSDKLSLCERCPVATEANHTPGCMNMSLASRLREVLFLLIKPLWNQSRSPVPGFGLPRMRKSSVSWSESSREWLGRWDMWCMKWLWEGWFCSVLRRLRWVLLRSTAMWWECVGKALPCFSWRSSVGRQEAADTDWNRHKILSRQ